jgi:hypothetical protein
MALYIYQPGIQPLGQFDYIDHYGGVGHDPLRGGEIGTLYQAPRVNTATEKAASDVFSGLVNTAVNTRVGVANWLNANSQRPLWLLDEGTTGYGTLFGQVIGTPCGLSTTGTNLGPHTMAGSGKVTCWDKPGLYAVSLDALDTTANTGFVVNNATLIPGAIIDVLQNGKLTPLSGAGVGVCVARFIEFETRPFLVTTPPSMVGAAEAAIRAIIEYHVGVLS